MPALYIALFCCTIICQAQQFPNISRTISNPQRTGPSRTFIKFQNGFFFNREDRIAASNLPNLYVYDQNGAPLYKASIWFDDAAQVVVHDASVKKDGSAIAVGNVLKNDGSGAYFLQFLNAGGSLDHTVRISPFVPFHVAIAPDGTIWVFGRRLKDPDGSLPSFNVLEKYSSSGVLLGSYLPRSSFQTEFDPASAVDSILCAGPNSIGLYSGATNEWIEVDLNGNLLGRWSAPLLAGGRARGMALGADGSAYAVFGDGKQTGLLRLDRSTSQWMSVALASASSAGALQQIRYLHGIDRNNLVVAAPEMTTAAWVALPPK